MVCPPPPNMLLCLQLCGNGCEQFGVLTTSGELFVAGCNSHGQLGVGHSHNIGSLGKVEVPKPVTAAALTYKHMLVVTADDAVYGSGVNTQGQLGTGNTASTHTPVLIPLMSGRRIVAVSCGYYHSMFLSTTGELYTCGFNEFGQLGQGTVASAPSPSPKQVSGYRSLADGLQPLVAASIACGYYHNAVVLKDGSLVM